ncbi:uncharacterized protein [Ptychodera flava]|uniref:uncharacterized protein n=1 Tax=Ptychodera flava TaxID=63121 RepID=UPI00396A99BE
MGELESSHKCIIAIVGVVVLVIGIVVPLSFSGVQYYEYGFPRRSTTGNVYTDKVYSSGLYAIGPDKKFKVFPATAHVERYDAISIFTSDKLEVDITFSLQYFLRPEDLKLLHDKHDLQYQPVLRASAVDALKGRAPDFSTDDYITSRSEVEGELFEAIRDRLGGSCCRKNCQDSVEGCVPNCVAYDTCTEEQKGYFADLRYFQLLSVSIASEVISNNLLALTQLEDAAGELYTQDAQVTRKNTERLVRDINNEAAELTQNATAISALIVAKAEAEAKAIIENAHNEGLSNMYTQLGISNDDHRGSFNYLRTLRDKENIQISVDFDSLRINTG